MTVRDSILAPLPDLDSRADCTMFFRHPRIYAPRLTTVISGGMPTRIGTIEQPSPPDTMRCRGAASLLPAALPPVAPM
jgi:hypothetical protein